MMKHMLDVWLTGAVDDRELAVLRERLGLHARGRLTDDWDAGFGSLVLRAREEGLVRLDLYRDLEEDGVWNFSLTYERDPLPAAEIGEWERRIRQAVDAAGLTVTKVSRAT